MQAASPSATHAPFRLLIALRARLVRNRVNQMLDEAPLRVFVSGVFILAIWVSLYFLFWEIFRFLRRSPEQAAVAVPYVFHIFFVAMTVLLAFSTAVLSYGALFAREEPGFLLAGPTPPRHIVGIAYLESLLFSSWSLVLLGLPLMLAIGRVQDLDWRFYAIFLAAFISFAPIPGAVGLLAAWAVALWMPRSARRILGWAVALALVGGLWWWSRLWGPVSGGGSEWLDRFLGQLSVLRNAMLPSTWASRTVTHAMQGQPGDAAVYLYVTAAHAVFLSWLAVGVVGLRFQSAYARARTMSAQKYSSRGGRLLESVTGVLFFFLPPPMRLLVAKDLRMFFRDPLQWSQLAILFGLLCLYLVYLPRDALSNYGPRMRTLFGFLNYSAVTLIISTFTSRFVFPMISLEGRQIWLVGLWPLPRRSVLWAKFIFALAVTLTATVSVTFMSARAIGLPHLLAGVLLLSTLTVCFGLCGLAIGLGARLPNFTERSAARVASGLGGTLNLIGSLALVLASLALTGWICLRLAGPSTADSDAPMMAWDRACTVAASIQVLLGLGVGILTMQIGQRHFERAEF